MTQPKYNPGRTWRLGLATETFGPAPTHPYYPGGQPGKQPPLPVKSKRRQTEHDTVKKGELYKSPADPHADLIVRALEDPGLLAGYSAIRNLPKISGSLAAESGYVWVPLRICAALDRVHRQPVASRWLTEVRPEGSGSGP